MNRRPNSREAAFTLRKLALALALAALASLVLTATAAASGPAWNLDLTSQPTSFAPGSNAAGSGQKALPQYTLVATNVGGGATSGPITISDTLPLGLSPAGAAPPVGFSGGGPAVSCSATGQTITCTSAGPFRSGGFLSAQIPVDVAGLPDPSTLTDIATIAGGGAATVAATTTTTVTSALTTFGFLPDRSGLGALLTDENGAAVTAAGSHPYQLTADLGLATLQPSTTALNSADGGVRNAMAALPPGLVVNPAATPVRCTEAQLESGGAGEENCPAASQVGIATGTTFLSGGPTAVQSALYNMVPPVGTPAELGTNALGVGVFVHIKGGVRAGDYALTAAANDILSRPVNPILGAQVQLWGDPSSSSHDSIRSVCLGKGGSCPVTPQTTPLLSMPTSCPTSLTMEAEADSWGHPGDFSNAKAQFSDANGNSTGVTGCNALQFSPSLQARPTTNAADSPSGLSADLHIPQTNNLSIPATNNPPATAHLRNAVVTLPEGLVINPSGANGLAGCTSAQIDLGKSNPPSCPDASKIGTVEVDTPLLDHPLPGAVYVATPHDNPFDSLLAIYVVVDDPLSGVVVKLAGHVVPDPNTGRLTTTFDENPQLPFEDFKLNFFGGATAPLRTPTVCGLYSTTSQLTPWSAPDSGLPAAPSDTYSINQGPNGSACATSQAAEPNKPSFGAGSISPIAGTFSPFVVNLRREDGSQQFSSVTLTPPLGLLGKLAGTPYCPESALAAAAAKSGTQEKASPSCPAASEIGTVTVGAGAGLAPYYAQGKAYLTGPYKGAPLSMAIITPATAGPFDLGTVVVRAALYVDPATAQITAVSDPIPQILQGIPLDVRSAQISLDKPSFTLNPTSCDPFAVTGQLHSTLGTAASLSSPFQVADCGSLAFKPRLSLSLNGGTRRGAHPKLRGVLTMPSGGANIARASVALPSSEFLDNAHINTVCTRVQYAARECPADSVYGFARAFSPLLDEPLEGPVYLRSSSHELPDLVAFLDGQIHVDVDGHIDSVKGGIRTTFEALPDAPVSKFVLEMQGGRKGLLVNSTNLCASVNRATAKFDAQNGKTHDFNPVLKNKCAKAAKKKTKGPPRRS